MGCSSFDWKAFVLDEVPRAERASYEGHAADCQDCAAELAALRLTRDALLTVRDEEVPRRIAFVSDKVFEPNWWQRLWSSGARLGFASAAMLAAAIVVHGFAVRPAPPVPAAAVDAAAIEKQVTDRVARLMEARLADSEKRQAEMLAVSERRLVDLRQADLVSVNSNYETLLKQVMLIHKETNRMAVGE